jgi:hypothetical protein
MVSSKFPDYFKLPPAGRGAGGAPDIVRGSNGPQQQMRIADSRE